MPSATNEASRRRGVYLLTHPRSASNLLQTMLADQPGLHNSSYLFFDAARPVTGHVAKGSLCSHTESERDGFHRDYQGAFDRLLTELAAAQEKGVRPMIKEHTVFLYGPEALFKPFYPEDAALPPFTVSRDKPGTTAAPPVRTNPTCLPDDILLSLQPVFQIRNPLLMFPSLSRAVRGAGFPHDLRKDATMSLDFSRALYDWYLDQEDAAKPLIIDADDVMNNRAAVRQMCVETGLDPDAVRYEWDTREEKHPAKARFLSTIYASNGILPGLDSKGRTIETETAKWKEEFGDEDGARLVELVRAAMPDYEYMHSRRVTA